MKKDKISFTAICIIGLCLSNSSCITQRCYDNLDCPQGMICNSLGSCVYECSKDQDCGDGFICNQHKCEPKQQERPLTCPEDMVVIANAFCIDKYEASRPDATDTSFGQDSSKATSRKNVLPWLVPDNSTAEKACKAVGKRLCSPFEWELACKGPLGTVYSYGDEYDPAICNGIETFGKGKFHLMPTGSFEGCTNAYGVFDMNGNVWEHVLGGDDKTVRGGAYNCSDSKTFQRCDYIPQTWKPAAVGFRCCYKPSSENSSDKEGSEPDNKGEK